VFLIFRNKPDETIELTSEEQRHARARRLRRGDVVYCGNGQGGRYAGILSRESEIKLDLTTLEERKQPRRNLISALPESSRRDWMLQKCTELGLTDFVPVIFARSENRGIPVSRMDRILLEAASQSRRFFLPVIHEAMDLLQAITWAKSISELYVLDPASGEDLREMHPSMSFLVGPEGGFADEERITLKTLPTRRMGVNILRIETAAIAALARSL